jgi:ketosteroid isomerase-like protein
MEPVPERQDVAQEILALERAALDRWGKGDPDGYLEISDPDVVYFDPFQPRRVDGLAALSAMYGELRGKIRIDRDEIVDPTVQVYGEVAVLTFRFNSQCGESQMRWNATEVYRRTADGWRIVHTHWSFTQPRLAQ